MPTKKVSSKGKSKPKALTKNQLISDVASKTGLTRSQVDDVFVALGELVGAELKGGRPIVVPGLVKITLQRKPATPARPGRHPSTGETIMFKAKPARNVVKVRAVKALKDLA